MKNSIAICLLIVFLLPRTSAYGIGFFSDEENGEGILRSGSYENLHFPYVHFSEEKFKQLEIFLLLPIIFAFFFSILLMYHLNLKIFKLFSYYFPESLVFIALGAICQKSFTFFKEIENDRFTISVFGNHTSTIERSEFGNFAFNILLPPIILQAAYSLNDEAVWQNMATIFLNVIISTLLNFFLIGFIVYVAKGLYVMDFTALECFLFASFIVAVDPVAVLAIFNELKINKTLYFIIFGESLFNDAVTIVLFESILSFSSIPVISSSTILNIFLFFVMVCLIGALIGQFFGVVSALATRLTLYVRVIEPVFIWLPAYSAYVLAEFLGASGVVAIIACGIMQAQYAFENISYKSKHVVKYTTLLASVITESMLFFFIGIFFVLHQHVYDLGFIVVSVIACLIVRVFITSLLNNVINTRRLRVLTRNEIIIMSLSGLRGAISFVLALNLKEEHFHGGSVNNSGDFALHQNQLRNATLTTTLVIVLFTTCIQGALMKPLLSILSVEKQDLRKKDIIEEISLTIMSHSQAGFQQIAGFAGYARALEIFKYFNRFWFRKILTNDCKDSNNIILTRFRNLFIAEHAAYISNLNVHKPRSSSSLNINQNVKGTWIPNVVKHRTVACSTGFTNHSNSSRTYRQRYRSLTIPMQIRKNSAPTNNEKQSRALPVSLVVDNFNDQEEFFQSEREPLWKSFVSASVIDELRLKTQNELTI